MSRTGLRSPRFYTETRAVGARPASGPFVEGAEEILASSGRPAAHSEVIANVVGEAEDTTSRGSA